jgi:hypothetical protein
MNGALKFLESLKSGFKDILKFEGVGEELSNLEEENWNNEKLTTVLFKYLLRESVQRPVAEVVNPKTTGLWSLIMAAKKTQESIVKLDPTVNIP